MTRPSLTRGSRKIGVFYYPCVGGKLLERGAVLEVGQTSRAIGTVAVVISGRGGLVGPATEQLAKVTAQRSPAVTGDSALWPL